ncbi:MAG: Gfo/Idh/MocA family oxidoreductase [Candidatus Poribacteria bacterium]
MASIIRAGIVGSGGRSSAHAHAYKEFGNVDIIAFCDVIEERAASRAKEFDAKAIYTDYLDLINSKSVDVISICSSNETHAEVTIAAAEAGIHVLCEKPMAQSLKECDDMITAAEKSGVKLAVNFQSRFFPRTHWVKQLIETGQMGDVVIAKGYGWTIHVWDLVRFVMGDLVHVSAEWGSNQLVHKDPLLATVRFANGHIGFMQASSRFSEPGLSEKQNCLSFVGRKATVSFELWSNELILSSADEEYAKKMEEAKAERFANQSLLAPSVPDIADFLNAIIHDKKLTIPGEEGRKSVEFVVATYKSALTGGPVKLPIEVSDSIYASTERPVSA